MTSYNLRPDLDIDTDWTMKETVDYIKGKGVYLTFHDTQIWLDCNFNVHYGHRLIFDKSYPDGKLKQIDIFDINENGQTWLSDVVNVSDLK